MLVRLAVNQTGVKQSEKLAKPTQVVDAFTGPQIWLSILITLFCLLPSRVITAYSATLAGISWIHLLEFVPMKTLLQTTSHNLTTFESVKQKIDVSFRQGSMVNGSL